jgi:methyl-accepting chemotaxis protein
MHKWSISAKLMAGFLGLAACVAALGLASLWAVNGLRDDLGDMSDKILRQSDLAADIQVNTWNIRAELRATLLSAALKRPQDVQKARNGAEQAFGRLDAAVQAIRPVLADEKAKAAAAGIAAMLPQWREAFHEVADLAAAGKVDAAYRVRSEKEAPLAVQIEEGPTIIREGARATADQRLDAANQRGLSNRWIIAAFMAVGLALAVLVFIMVRSLSETLRRFTVELASGADQVAAASGQIATTSQSLSQGSSEQASAVEEVSASMHTMSDLATTVINETADQIERSNAALSEMVGSMNLIKASSERVAKINKTIDEIAFQTNILALNAAVEAARAGEAGKGFAVVADEVRNLAQRAAAAAKDTAALIEESIVNSNQGVLKVELVSEAIRGITRSSGKIKELVGAGNGAGKQQSQGSIQQVSTAIQQVNIVTQSNASAAEESAAAAEELNAQSMTVRELASNLRRMVDGGEDRPLAFQNAGHFGNSNSRPGVVATAEKGVRAHSDEFPMETGEPGSFRQF